MSIVLENVKDLDLSQTLSCGQCFRWKEHPDGSFSGVVRGRYARVSSDGDRLILDGAELYHLGASLKDLGRKYCAVTKMDAMFIPSIMQRV